MQSNHWFLHRWPGTIKLFLLSLLCCAQQKTPGQNPGVE
jgi:hypothetical protein